MEVVGNRSLSINRYQERVRLLPEEWAVVKRAVESAVSRDPVGPTGVTVHFRGYAIVVAWWERAWWEEAYIDWDTMKCLLVEQIPTHIAAWIADASRYEAEVMAPIRQAILASESVPLVLKDYVTSSQRDTGWYVQIVVAPWLDPEVVQVWQVDTFQGPDQFRPWTRTFIVQCPGGFVETIKIRKVGPEPMPEFSRELFDRVLAGWGLTEEGLRVISKLDDDKVRALLRL